MSRRGTLYSYSIVHSGTAAFKDKTPYLLAIVEENQRKSIACIEGYSDGIDVCVGMEVEFLAEAEDGIARYRFV